MTLERCYSSIDRYLNREDESAPRFVNVESVEDMVAIVDHYNVGENIFLTVEKYSSEDENPRIEDLLNDLATLQGNIFLMIRLVALVYFQALSLCFVKMKFHIFIAYKKMNFGIITMEKA